MPEPNANDDANAQDMAELNELRQEASMLGFNSVKEYVTFLSKEEAPPPPSPPPPVNKPADSPPPSGSPAPQGNSGDDDASRRASYTAFITSQWTQHEVDQLKKPPEERDETSRDDYLKMINSGLGPVLMALAKSEPECRGNVFTAAKLYRDLKANKASATQRRTDSNALRTGAMDSIQMNPDTQVPVFKTDAEWTGANASIADAIAPKRGGFEG